MVVACSGKARRAARYRSGPHAALKCRALQRARAEMGLFSRRDEPPLAPYVWAAGRGYLKAKLPCITSKTFRFVSRSVSGVTPMNMTTEPSSRFAMAT